MAGPMPVDRDARGILDPDVMLRVASLNRYPAGPVLDGIVAWFWAVRWSLPDGVVHTQPVLTHPGANLSVGHAEPPRSGPLPGGSTELQAMLYGVTRRISARRLAGDGWTVAAMTVPGGLGALLRGPAAAVTDRRVPLGPALGQDGPALLREVAAAPVEAARVAVLRERLERVVAAAEPARLAAAREVAAAARLAESDRSLRRAGQLAATLGVTTRTLQRLFAEYAGVSPAWVLRRYRLLEAAERARLGAGRSWAELAAELGYSDQAHLVRDFARHLGTTPAAYAARQPARGDGEPARSAATPR